MTQTLKRNDTKTTLYPLFRQKFDRFLNKKTLKMAKKTPTVTILRGNFCRKKFTGKERDSETGLYYYGARYLDPKISRWISGDPAVSEYVPSAPVSEEARKQNQNLPGMGGVFNYVNLHTYNYSLNNPIKYSDPDGQIPFMVVTGIIGAVAGAGISIAADVSAGKDINWGRAGGAAAAGALIGLTLGAATATLATATAVSAGNAAASFSAVTGYGAATATAATTMTATSTATVTSAVNKFGANDLVLGLNNNGALQNWTRQFGGKTFGMFSSTSRSFSGQIRDAMSQAKNIRINLDGIDLSKICGTLNQFGEPLAENYTNYELYLLKTVPEFLEKATFYLNNVQVSSPF